MIAKKLERNWSSNTKFCLVLYCELHEMYKVIPSYVSLMAEIYKSAAKFYIIQMNLAFPLK